MLSNGTKKNALICLTEETIGTNDRRFIASFKSVDRYGSLESSEEEDSETETTEESSEEQIDQNNQNKRDSSNILAGNSNPTSNKPNNAENNYNNSNNDLSSPQRGLNDADAETLLNTFSVEQRNALLLVYANISPANQTQLDGLLKNFIKADKFTLGKCDVILIGLCFFQYKPLQPVKTVKFKTTLQHKDEQQQKSITIGKLKIKSTSKTLRHLTRLTEVDFALSDKVTLQGYIIISNNKTTNSIFPPKKKSEYKRFWYEGATRSSVTSQLSLDLAKYKKISTYLPKLVLRRLYNKQSPIQLPEIETFPAVVAFADISGYTKLTGNLK